MSKSLMVGYLESWGNMTFTEAAKSGYNVLVMAFGTVNGTDVNIFNSRFNPSPTPEALTEDIANAKKSGAKEILFSVGGGNNTYNPGNASPDDLAEALINFIKPLGFTGIDFDLEIEGDADYLDSLCEGIKSKDPSLKITAAPQINQGPHGTDLFYVSTGSHMMYNKAITNKRFDYLFVQDYNNQWPSLNGLTERDIPFISEAFNNLKKCTPVETGITIGLPACKKAAGTSIFESPGTPESIYQAVAAQYREIKNDKQFAGAMCWSINLDAGNNFSFVKSVREAI